MIITNLINTLDLFKLDNVNYLGMEGIYFQYQSIKSIVNSLNICGPQQQ